MKLLAPELVGPLSVCSESAKIRGNVAGASLEIRVADVIASSHISEKPDGTYKIGVGLEAGQKVTVRQALAGQLSPESLPIPVQAAPAHIGAVAVKTPPHGCGRALEVSGAVPGASVEIHSGGVLVGSGTVPDGTGWIGFNLPPDASETLTVTQTSCNNLTSAPTTVKTVPLPKSLPAPLMHTPIFECETRIGLRGIAAGAYVELYRNSESVPEDTFVFAGTEGTRWIAPLAKNDTIKVRQGFSCKAPGPPLEMASTYTSAKAEAAASVPKPKFLSTPCPGGIFVVLGDLVPGARVVLSRDGVELGETDAPGTEYTFPVPALTSGSTLEAYMQMCDARGPTAKVTVSGESFHGQIFAEPVYACASAVEVLPLFGRSDEGGHSHIVVYITNENGEQISAYQSLWLALAARFVVPVSPCLRAGQQVRVHARVCDGKTITSDPVKVSGDPPPTPYIDELFPGVTAFTISSGAGFMINVYMNGVWIISYLSGSLTDVPLPRPARSGDKFALTQTVCGVESKMIDVFTLQ